MSTVCYVGYIDKNHNPGVVRKVSGILQAFKLIGYKTNECFVSFTGLNSHYRYLKFILHSNSKIIIIRLAPNVLANYILPFVLIIKRMQRRFVVIEIPSPIVVGVDEVKTNFVRGLRQFGYLFIIQTTMPWSIWPASKVIQYADDSWRFSLFLKHKTVLINNSISVESITCRNKVPFWDRTELILLGVATVARWHGYDRVLRGIHEYNSSKTDSINNRNIKIKFIIAGDGPELINLKMLCEELCLQDNVIFMGWVESTDLSLLYEEVHVGVSSLAGFRKKVFQGSCLKAREYVASGLPFISAQRDTDFNSNLQWILKIEALEEPLNISEVISWYDGLDLSMNSVVEMRDYANLNFDHSQRISVYQP